MTARRVAAVVAAAFALNGPTGPASAAGPTTELVARGKYVFATAGGCACHTPPDAVGLNAGGMKFDLFIGVVYSRNITPDPETGIGAWTDAQVTNAIRRGERPDGSKLFPIHPYKYLGNIADDEIAALVAYLKSVTPIKSSVPARSLKIPVPSLTIPTASKVAPRDGLARGAYLAGGAGHCTECHTPRRFDFSPDDAKFLAGGPGPQRSRAANITPHGETGIGRWTETQIARFLRTGVKPSGQEASSLMKTVITGTSAGFKDLTEADAAAIARYLKTVPAIENKVR
jgi:mono/diheme cytochrome c family protein